MEDGNSVFGERDNMMIDQARVYEYLEGSCPHGSISQLQLFDFSAMSVEDGGIRASFHVKDLDSYGALPVLELHHATLINGVMVLVYGRHTELFHAALITDLETKCVRPVPLRDAFDVEVKLTVQGCRLFRFETSVHQRAFVLKTGLFGFLTLEERIAFVADHERTRQVRHG